MQTVEEIYAHNEVVRKALISYLGNMLRDFNSTGLPRGKLESTQNALPFYVDEYIDGRSVAGMQDYIRAMKKDDTIDYSALLTTVVTQLNQIKAEFATALTDHPKASAFTATESAALSELLPAFKALLEAA